MAPETGGMGRDDVAHLRHELRTPINQIVGYCELLLEDADAPESGWRREPLTQALQAAREATAQIERALPPTLEALSPVAPAALLTALTAPQSRIVAAMDALLGDARASADAAFVADLRRVRDAAGPLTTLERPSAAPSSGTPSAETPANATSPVVAAPRGRSAHILVVDDVEENRSVLQRRLQREGHTVTCAAGGREALALAARESFDLVLLDVMMPDLDGPAVLGRFRADPQLAGIPVVFVTAKTLPSELERFRALGAADVISKPFDAMRLLEQVRMVWERLDGR